MAEERKFENPQKTAAIKQYRELKNTRRGRRNATKRRSTVERALAGCKRHAEQHPNCLVTKQRIAKLEARLKEENLLG